MSLHDHADMPFYFGANSELFGMFHATAAHASKAVLLCPPLGQDQIRCHRLYRQLACALASQGVAVLRFDYYGTGDSAGSSMDVDWNRCVADAIVAVGELRARSGAAQITAFGARLGGSVALAAAEQAALAGVAVCDPVLDGAAYVAQLDDMQMALAADMQRFIKPRSIAEATGQWLGFDISDRLRHQMGALKLQPVDAPLLVLDSSIESSTVNWQKLSVDGKHAVLKLQPPIPWHDLQRVELAILSHPLIQSLTSYVREAA